MAKGSRQAGGRSIFRTILVGMLILLAVAIAVAIVSLWGSGVLGRLDENDREILAKQTENRAAYLENSMVHLWSDLTQLSRSIDHQVEGALARGDFTLEELDSGSDVCADLLLSVADDCIATLYARRVSGLFVVFNTHDLDEDRAQGVFHDKPGLYIRDMDPISSPSVGNSDLLLERAPIRFVQSRSLSTDAAWRPLFPFGQEGRDYYDFLYEPFQAAFHDMGMGAETNYAYWTDAPYNLAGDPLSAISYSLPLILPDGRVYGVLGVELLTDYLYTLLPAAELADPREGAYFLAVASESWEEEERLTLSPILASGERKGDFAPGERLTLTRTTPRGGHLRWEGGDYYATIAPLQLYSNNAPFEEEQWLLIGGATTGWLYDFSHQMRLLLGVAVLLTIVAGVGMSLLISRRLARPVRILVEEVDAAQQRGDGIPQLPETGIRELDRFAQAITGLSRDVVAASARFLQIMDMVSVELGGFEVDHETGSVFLTENFFPLLGVEGVRPHGKVEGIHPGEMDEGEFMAQMDELDRTLDCRLGPDGNKVYRVPLPQGGERYVRVETTQRENRLVGLAEDVTTVTLERLRIEHDRDYDLLTGLLSRRAFHRLVEERFAHPEALGHAALVMLDLDNLKVTNDQYGHDWGDQYIRQAGQCFAASVPAGTLCARVSGDEFAILLTGYSDKDAIRRVLNRFSQGVRSSVFTLPDGTEREIQVSGGVAWYPEDSRTFADLMRMADFAMYQVKNTQKGKLGEFDLGSYNRESYLLQVRREFFQLLEEEDRLRYAFQPIVDGRTGEVAAYEALMRVNLPTLRAPDTVLAMAKQEGRLADIERITWFRTAESYQALLDSGQVPPQCRLFINSIAGVCMTREEEHRFLYRFGHLRDRIVIEITESETLDPVATQRKRQGTNFAGAFALDDYGSGYNSEKNLLELGPQYIKVDISIIRGIDADPDKRQIVDNIVHYAHARGMLVIAEGLETAAEVAACLALGVDLLQGYFLARPAPVPVPVSREALAVIRAAQTGGDASKH